ncbi:MAG: DUF3426 domain-containing protein [Gammaproteobacteria bacterium]|nr:DUF3426 domain-containing protein [Gammaproteobacteria bacterium]
MDILNSLIDGNTQASSDNELLDELDDINKTLSDSSDSLDDELSRLGNDFDDLDSGDDLLAELEQLESDFLNNDKKSPVHSTDSSIQAGGSLHADGSLHAEGSSLDDMFASDTGSGQLDNSVTAVTDLDESTQKEQEPFSSTTKANEVQDEVVPSFLTQSDSTNTNPGAMLAWLAGSIILLLLLSAQYLHVNSSKFAQNPNVRPLLETLCPITNCSLPLTKTPRKIVTVNHDVRSHPTVNNALEIQLSFKNKANYTQGYPILEITFSNPLGEVIARRKFSPEEYLTGDIQYARGMKAQQSQEINLKIVDPDPGSLLSFQFNYL